MTSSRPDSISHEAIQDIRTTSGIYQESEPEERTYFENTFDRFDYLEDKSEIPFMSIHTKDGTQDLFMPDFEAQLERYATTYSYSGRDLCAFDYAGAAITIQYKDDGSVVYELCDGNALQTVLTDDGYVHSIDMCDSRSDMLGLHIGSNDFYFLSYLCGAADIVDSDIEDTKKYQVDREDYKLELYTIPGGDRYYCFYYRLTMYKPVVGGTAAEETGSGADYYTFEETGTGDDYSTSEVPVPGVNEEETEQLTYNYPDIWDFLPFIEETPSSRFEYEVSEELGGIAITDYLGSSEELRIPDSIDGMPVVSADLGDTLFTELILPDTLVQLKCAYGRIKYANYPNSALDFSGFGMEKLYIGSSVKAIPDKAFYNCNNLTDVAIPDSVRSIGKEAFSYCDMLPSIYIPDSVTSIGDSAFYHCPALTSIRLSDKLDSIAPGTFSYCYSLKDVVLPDKVTSIGEGAFQSCTSVTAIDLPSGLALIGICAFSDTALRSVTIPSGVRSMDAAFSGCQELTNVIVSDGVTAISNNMFSSCKKLTDVSLPESVKTIGDGAFSYCDALSYIRIPDSVTEIGSCAFYESHALSKIDMPKTMKVLGEGAFCNCSALVSVVIPEGITELADSSAFGMFQGCTSLESVVIPGSIRKIGMNAFSCCSSLSSVTIPDSVKEIGYSAFAACTGLISVVIPDSVEIIGDYAFLSCFGLTSIVLPDNIKPINYTVFDRCTALTDIAYKGKLYSYESLDKLYKAISAN